MPQPATSFGATINDGWLYYYGGNTGKAHEFNRDCIRGEFFRLHLPDGSAWEKLPGGPALMGASLVADGGRTIRIGGMSAHNEKGAPNDLFSSDEVAAFDPATRQWAPLPKLPEARSSADAAILGHTLYVGGGWTLAGREGDKAKSTWADKMFSLDLQAPEKGWQTIPQQFQRRAIAVAVHAGRLWFLGGMEVHDELSRHTDWYDPASGEWGHGPDLPDTTMAGFGMAACDQGGRLYASPVSGKLLVLSADGAKWDEAGALATPRFFHRLLPLADGRLIALGGSGRKDPVLELELVAPGTKSAAGAEWPQWRGPRRDGVSTETGWNKAWPAEGPRRLWSAGVGLGMSSPAVAGGKLFIQGNDGHDTDSILAFDAASGAAAWRYSLPCKTASHEMAIVPNGPGATPTVSGGHVFALTREGDFVCLDASSGHLVWRKNLVTDLGGKRPIYGYTQSPLVAEGRVFLDLGSLKGETGSTAALDAATGEVKWRAGTGEAGYSAARLFERDGHPYVAMLKGEALDVFDPADGRVLWSHPLTGRDFTNAVTPVFVDHRILVGNTTDPFARLLDWDTGATPNVRTVWENKQFGLLFNNPILHDGLLFAFNEKNRGHAEFMALDAQTGETKWSSDAVPIGTFILADGQWIFLTREGEVVLAPADAHELKPTARFKALEGKCYATPTLADGCLYVRSNDGHLAAFDLH
jgi:outer membrane protein assembly factor BamB